MAKQKKYSFDQITINKVLRGAVLSATGAFALFILNYIGSLDISDPSMASFVAFAVPFSINAIKEWTKGK